MIRERKVSYLQNNMSVGVISLGCAKNRIDTEEFLGLLSRKGYNITADTATAEIIIINTCAFISDARDESLETIREAAELKRCGSCRLLVVTGCLPQKYHRQLLSRMPEIDLLTGVHGYEHLGKLLEKALKNKVRLASFKKPPAKYRSVGERMLTLPGHSAYLKISEGCNNRCHYCIIPGIRGPYRSRPLDSIIKEAKELVIKGTREINLVAQDTTYYGRENGGKPLLPTLLKKLADISKLRWIRLLYAHPEHLDDETIEVMTTENKICSYIDLPLQHINSRILRDMGRNYTREHAVKLIKKLRSHKMTIRSTFMVGYPGETESMFKELLSFLEEHPLDRVGVFTYSAEKDTPSYYRNNHIAPAVKQNRYNRIMSLQKSISHSRNRHFAGRHFTVMVEGVAFKIREGTFYRGRTAHQAPEVDGSVLFSADKSFYPGEMVNVKIYGCGSYDFLGIHC